MVERFFRDTGGETMMNKRAFITAHKAQYAVSTLCRLLEISRGWFYGFLASQPARDQRKADRDARDLELLPKIRTFFKASKKCYGSKRIHRDLRADGEVVSEGRVYPNKGTKCDIGRLAVHDSHPMLLKKGVREHGSVQKSVLLIFRRKFQPCPQWNLIGQL